MFLFLHNQSFKTLKTVFGLGFDVHFFIGIALYTVYASIFCSAYASGVSYWFGLFVKADFW